MEIYLQVRLAVTSVRIMGGNPFRISVKVRVRIRDGNPLRARVRHP